jgi:diaminohydroxyphosphoribosylaminopyrimidine deaminase/5-amino-6-(5-phosphoribosylamino)uracil reductase
LGSDATLSGDRSRDARFMRRAIALAQKGWGQTAPNPMVGAVVVHGTAIVGEGWHARFGEAHAEVAALAAAGERARGATVYVSLEPCAHHGKTPPCADALIAAGVSRVVFAAADPSAAGRGGGERLRAAGIAVDGGVEEPVARETNAPWFHDAMGATRPWVTLKLAVSLDGAIAGASRTPGWLTGEAARREVHRLRANADALAVGIGTAIADDPQLTVRGRKRPRVAPTRVVFDRRARLPLTSRLVRTARKVPVVVIAEHADATRAAALGAAGVGVIPATGLPDALIRLHARGVRHLLVEGGAALTGALLDDALVDRLIIFQAPILLGRGALAAFGEVAGRPLADAARWSVVARKAFGDDLMTVYAPRR